MTVEIEPTAAHSSDALKNTATLWLAGISLTIAWLLIAGGLLWWKWDTLDDLSLNEWGDFLAGFVAPLALLWLVLGYFQQGIELRQNTETLKLQQQALARQVAETATLAQHAARQADAAEIQGAAAREEVARGRAARHEQTRPFFKKAYAERENGKLTLVNRGERIEEVTVSDEGGFFPTPLAFDLWTPAQFKTLHCRPGLHTRLTFTVEYTDLDGVRWRDLLQLTTDGRLETLRSDPRVSRA